MAAGNTLAHLGWPGQPPAQPPLLADVGLTNDALLRDPRSLRPSDQRQHERLMSTSMGTYAAEREALRHSRNRAVLMGRTFDDGYAPPAASPTLANSGWPADGTRTDPRLVDARQRPSDAEIGYLRRELMEEQRRLLALEEQLGQHKAREGRIGRTVDSALSRGYPMPNATPPVTPSAQAVANLPASGAAPAGRAAGGGYELESIYSAMRAQQWEIEALGRECRQLTELRRGQVRPSLKLPPFPPIYLDFLPFSPGLLDVFWIPGVQTEKMGEKL